jgi:hypothetical protein
MRDLEYTQKISTKDGLQSVWNWIDSLEIDKK